MDYESAVGFVYDNLKISPLRFGIAGEIYSEPAEFPENCRDIMNKYIFTYQNVCVNRRKVYYSTYLDETLSIAETAESDYSFVRLAKADTEQKRYVLITIVEYAMHSVCKLLNLCFDCRAFKNRFYESLKMSLEHYTDVLTGLLFTDSFPDIRRDGESAELIRDIACFYTGGVLPVLREHVEYDSKLLLIFAYILYIDLIPEESLILCPLLGAAQIPEFFKSMDKHFRKLSCCHNFSYEYVKYSTYDLTDFIPLETQISDIAGHHDRHTKVLLLDESLGTGTTLLTIKNALAGCFEEIKTGAVEFRWDKKIVHNTDREWFDIDKIDYVTPLSYRHYLLLTNQTACFKMNISDPRPYIPFMVYNDPDFKRYMSKQEIGQEKKTGIECMIEKSALIMKIFYIHKEELI